MAITHHVVPSKDGGWNVTKGGAERASKHFPDKETAVRYGREVSENQGSELYIHRRDGTIQTKDSHGQDHHPPKDRDTH